MSDISRFAISDEGFLFDPSTGQSYTTNATGLKILRLLKEGKSEDEIVSAVFDEYDCGRDEIHSDVVDFIRRLESFNLSTEI